jgi:hypothetical protein
VTDFPAGVPEATINDAPPRTAVASWGLSGMVVQLSAKPAPAALAADAEDAEDGAEDTPEQAAAANTRAAAPPVAATIRGRVPSRSPSNDLTGRRA